MPKLAFLFLTIDNLNHEKVWNLFFAGVNKDKYSIYCHPKFPLKVTNNLLKKQIIHNRVNTKWGDISCVQAYINLLRRAYKDPNNQRFITISESCLPIYNFEFIYQQLITERPCIQFYRNCEQRWHSLRDKSFVAYDKFLKSNIQGLCFDRQLAEHYLKNLHYEVFKTSIIPEEHYFINVLIHDHYDLKKINNRRLTHAEWSQAENNGRSPKSYQIIDMAIVAPLRTSGYFFMRKIRKNGIIVPELLAEIKNN